MSEIIIGRDEIFGRWAAGKIPQIGNVQNFGQYIAVGVATGKEKSAKLQAVVIFHDYYPQYGHCQISVAAEDPRWVSKRNIRSLLAIPFLQYKCHTVRVSAIHTRDRVIGLAVALGFKREAILADYFGKGKHAAVLRMGIDYYMRRYWSEQAKQEAA